MDRRTFLKATGACAATTAAATAAAATPAATVSTNARTSSAYPATTAPATTLRLAMSWPDNLTGPSDQIRRLARDIKSISNGRLAMKVSSPANAPPDPETDLTFGPFHTQKNAHKAALYFEGLPHSAGMSAANLETWLTIAGGQPLWDELAASEGVKPILAGHLGELPGLWSKTPIHSVTDLVDSKIAVQGITADIMRAIGAKPVAIPPAKLQDALANGTVDVAQCGGLQSAMSLGLHKVAKQVITGIANPSGTALALTIPLDTWHTLGHADQTIITTCASQAYRLTLAENRALETPLSVSLRDHHGVKILTPSNSENKSWERISDTFLAHIASSDERTKRINASYTAFKTLSA